MLKLPSSKAFQPKLNHASYLAMRWSHLSYSPFTCPTSNWESPCMMIFSEDTEVARSIPARMASYSTSLLDAGKSNRISCYIISPVRALSCKPTSTLVCRETPSTLKIHQSTLPRSASCCRISAKKSTNICPFIAKRGLYWIPNLLNSIAHWAIFPYKSGFHMVLRRGRLVSTTIGCAWK